MLTVTMCTGNEGKFRTAQEHLAPWGIEVEQVVLDLDEIQTTSVAVIAQHKAQQAFRILQRPVFVKTPASTSTSSKDGQGPWSNTPWKPSAPKALLTSQTSRRLAPAASPVLPYTRMRTANCTRSRTILWSIFIPDGASTTLAALPAEQQQRLFSEWGRRSVVAAMGEWLAQSR